MIRKILTGIAAVTALYFFIVATYSIYQWSFMTDRAWASVQIWKVVELSSSQFAIEAEYCFTHNGMVYKGLTRFSKPYQYNRLAAEKEIEKKKEARSIAFYDPENPKRSSLERFFPLKKSLYALCAIGIGLYFFLLGRMFFKKGME
ncbi:MAG: hypothetical protein KGZ39_06780 [Simkania sp.]|nr:hypothetical protein [Simkania sp.]